MSHPFEWIAVSKRKVIRWPHVARLLGRSIAAEDFVALYDWTFEEMTVIALLGLPAAYERELEEAGLTQAEIMRCCRAQLRAINEP